MLDLDLLIKMKNKRIPGINKISEFTVYTALVLSVILAAIIIIGIFKK